MKEAEESYLTSLKLYQLLAEKDKIHLPEVAVASYNLGIFYQETREEDVNEYLRLAFETAGQCLELSEQCREIYENLENEPLYEGQETGTSEDMDEGSMTDSEAAYENAEESAEIEESEDAESDRADSETETESDSEAETKAESEEIGKQKSGGWFQKLFGKK